jgi:uncharacterized protein (TIGR03085 family)
MARLARAERTLLADLLHEVGPARRTLCTGWATHDLAAHLVTRERSPQAGPGLVVPALHGFTERAERATMRAHTYPELVEMFRSGPAWWNPSRIGPFDEATNFVEFYVHSEDVRRTEPAIPRPGGAELPKELRDRFWSSLRMIAFAGLRHAPVGVVAERTDTGARTRLRRGQPEVVLAGPPEELLLYAFGRRGAAEVVVRGDDDAVAAFEQAPPSL